MSRKLTLLGLIIMPSIASFSAVVPPQTKELKKISLSGLRVGAATAAARARGLFAREGLEVDVSQTLNSTAQMRGLSKGEFQLASTGFDNVLAWSGREGAESIAVAQISDRTVLPVF